MYLSSFNLEQLDIFRIFILCFIYKIPIFLISLFCKKINIYIYTLLQIIFGFVLFYKGKFNVNDCLDLSYAIRFFTKIYLYVILMNYKYIIRKESIYHEFRADVIFILWHTLFNKLNILNYYQYFILFNVILFNLANIIYIYKYIDEIKFNFISNNSSNSSNCDNLDKAIIIIENLFINILLILSFNFKSYALIYYSKTNSYLVIFLLIGEFIGSASSYKLRKLSFLFDFVVEIAHIISFFTLKAESLFNYAVALGIGTFNGHTSLMIYKNKDLSRDLSMVIQLFIAF